MLPRSLARQKGLKGLDTLLDLQELIADVQHCRSSHLGIMQSPLKIIRYCDHNCRHTQHCFKCQVQATIYGLYMTPQLQMSWLQCH